MGGGKTHLLVGFGLLARHPELRAARCPHIATSTTSVAPTSRRSTGATTPKHFFWGKIASQLGKGELFKEFWTAGPKAPDETDWLHLFEGDEPILILLDEMPPYFHYLDTQTVGNGTVADIALRAFAELLTAAGKKANVCVVVSDLAAAYTGGTTSSTGRLTMRAPSLDARSGTSRRSTWPLTRFTTSCASGCSPRFPTRRRSGTSPPPTDASWRRPPSPRPPIAERRPSPTRSPRTYPFHPRLKNVIALFKENEQFKQTRGLIELVSRLLKSVWERSANDVFLIGPQHFDLSIPAVRDKLTEISGMRDVIAKDLWDAQSSAHAQVIDLEAGREAATQVGSLLFTASLSTAVNAVKGLTREEMVECLVSPLT